MKTYICSVGTSASQDVIKNEEFLKKHLPQKKEKPSRLDANIVQELGGVEETVKAMKPFFLALDYKNEEHLRKGLSAEIHSLVRCQLDKSDKVFLLYSDTPDGEVCAKLVEEYLLEKKLCEEVKIEKIEGLQIDEPGKFRSRGVPNYLEAVIGIGEKMGWPQSTLNPTGGYKALVPYTTLLGMIFGAEVCYIFDNSKELLHLPPLPIDFDDTKLNPLLPAMERIEKETAIREAEFWGTTPQEDRIQYKYLVEKDNQGLVTLSAIGLLVYKRLTKNLPRQQLKIYLSLQAWEDLKKAPSDWDVKGFLNRLRTRSDAEKYLHKREDDTLWLKPGNTSDRYRIELENDKLLVFRILSHEEYDRSVNREWSKKKYAPFTLYDFIE